MDCATLVLLGMIIFRLFKPKDTTTTLALTTISGSIGGILATAFGFSFPTLYFLDPVLFNGWMRSPIYFVSAMAGLGLAAGGCGMVFANVLEKRLIDEEKLAFPIGQLVYKMISVGHHLRKAYELVFGFVTTTIFCMLQDGFLGISALIPKSITVIQKVSLGFAYVPTISFDIWPMLWAIGFVTGHVIAIPLTVGALSKMFLVDPLNTAPWFEQLSNMEFVLAFCSGMVLQGVIVSFFALPSLLKSTLEWFKGDRTQLNFSYQEIKLFEWIAVAMVTIGFLSYFGFSPIAQIYLIVATFACTYQIATIAGKIGLAPLGRFATFVMVPGMLFFQFDHVQIVIIATFVEICGGVAADVLFGRKIAKLAHIDRRTVLMFQILGLVVSSLVIGIVFWHLISNLGLGSPQLFAYKAQSRRLLIDAKQFDIAAMVLGAIFSYVLKFLNINPMLALGGLLMPINISLGLIFGGF